MNSPIVQNEPQPQPGYSSVPTVDPLSEVLSLLKPQSYSSGAFPLAEGLAVSFPKHQGIKCYAILAGECWIVVDTVPEPVLLKTGDCFLLPRGLPFHLTTDLALKPISYLELLALKRERGETELPDGAPAMAGGHFSLSGAAAEMLLQSLPPIVHIRREADKRAMVWSLERMREELRDPRPGGTLIAQQLAYMMLVQALRLHLSDATTAGPGWLSALADKHMGLAIKLMHNEPGRAWTLLSLAECVGMSRSVFAERFRATVGATPMEYLTRWRMLLAAERLKSTRDSLGEIAQSLGYESESAFGKARRWRSGQIPEFCGWGQEEIWLV